MKNIFLLVVALLCGCATSLPTQQSVPIDQLPMYGGMDRSAIPELKAADEKLIADTTMHYGSREKAGAAFVNNGFSYYQNDDHANAMRRFNQAWLLDQNNPQVYWGFSSVLHDQEKYCEAMKMIDRALSLNPPKTQGLYPDAGRVFTLCAVSDGTLSSDTKVELLERSEFLYLEAEKFEPNKAYLYESLASAYFWRGQYGKAWAMIAKSHAAGGKPDEDFLSLLRAKLVEPEL